MLDKGMKLQQGLQIPFQEVHTATRLIPHFFTRFRLDLCVGDYRLEGLSEDMVQSLRTVDSYDADLLPVMFNARELFWQPNLLPTPAVWCTRFNIFNAFIRSYIAALQARDMPVDYLYAAVLHDMYNKAVSTQKALLLAEQAPVHHQFRILMKFRVSTYPHILLFLQHPLVKADVLRVAHARLDLMVRAWLFKTKESISVFRPPYYSLQAITKKKKQRSSTNKCNTSQAGALKDTNATNQKG